MAMMVLIGPTIAAGENISNALNVSSGGVYRIVMPNVWTSAVITFQLSYDGNEFYNVYDRDGNETLMRCEPMSVVPIGEYLFYIHSLKIRSGTRREPVAQPLAAVFKVILETKAPTAWNAHTGETEK